MLRIRIDPFRLFGFGHRVYKTFDRRAIVMRDTCHEVLDALHKDDNPLLAVEPKLEKIALSDEYFIERNLYPNVDFYSGIILNAIGIPNFNVHRYLCNCKNYRLDLSLE